MMDWGFGSVSVDVVAVLVVLLGTIEVEAAVTNGRSAAMIGMTQNATRS